MQSVCAIRQHGIEPAPLNREGVSIQPEDVVRVDGADGGFEAGVEGWEADVLRVAGLVDGVVAGDPGVGAVAGGELGPEPDGAVLVVAVVPEGGVVGGVVGVPVRVLAAGEGVHVEDGVDVVFGALGEGYVSGLDWMGWEGREGRTRSITRSRCLNPLSFSTRGFISSSKWR